MLFSILFLCRFVLQLFVLLLLLMDVLFGFSLGFYLHNLYIAFIVFMILFLFLFLIFDFLLFLRNFLLLIFWPSYSIRSLTMRHCPNCIFSEGFLLTLHTPFFISRHFSYSTTMYRHFSSAQVFICYNCSPFFKLPIPRSPPKIVPLSDSYYRDWETDRKSTRLNSSHITRSRMPSSA